MTRDDYEHTRRQLLLGAMGLSSCALFTGVEAARQSQGEEYSVIWSVSESDVVSVAADNQRIYVATSNNIRSHDPQTGAPRSVIGSTDDIREMVATDQFLYIRTGTGLEKYNKDGGRQWRRPVESPTEFTATSDGLFAVGGFK